MIGLILTLLVLAILALFGVWAFIVITAFSIRFLVWAAPVIIVLLFLSLIF